MAVQSALSHPRLLWAYHHPGCALPPAGLPCEVLSYLVSHTELQYVGISIAFLRRGAPPKHQPDPHHPAGEADHPSCVLGAGDHCSGSWRPCWEPHSGDTV